VPTISSAIEAITHSPFAFLVPALALLSMPGPSNMLLATSGACFGLRPSLRLIPAEVSGYMTSISLLSVLAGSSIAAMPSISILMKATCGAYLLHLSVCLWLHPTISTIDQRSRVTFANVFVTTFFNPKAAIFALWIVPHASNGNLYAAAPFLAVLCALIAMTGIGWMSLGAILRRDEKLQVAQHRVHQFAAVVLSLFGVTLLTQVVSAIAQTA